MSLRLLRASHATGRVTEGIEVRESDGVAAPVTLGILRPAIVLPLAWREWGPPKLDSVLAHERSHILRHDPAVQALSAIHRALLWHSPLSWFLHQRIVRVAEEASDDAAVAATGDRALYAEVLLAFLQRGVTRANRLGVPMARYGRPDRRIQRILDGAALARGVTRWSLAAILLVGSPLAWVVAAAHPQAAPSEARSAAPETDSLLVPTPPPGRSMARLAAAQKSLPAPQPRKAPAVLNALGNVTPFYTVSVKPRIDGLLTSVSFKEGDLVAAGQVLASVDSRALEFQLAQAEGQLRQDQGFPASNLPDGKLKTDQAIVDNAKLQLSYAQITAPVTGLAGLRLIDPGNLVHAADSTAIVVITQLQPIAVLFTIPEDALPAVRT
ncbi:MAG TPA: M56 family metallopeptidase, partial [Bryobacteraceae bacterium]|nr:M56 family metallopeptidase [Bryobacteraceae bacterium]